jgi:MoxR-like ATPase
MVTIDRVTYPLPDNFTVFATQNPIEYEGTYPLPEAQKDRFMLKITMDYPAREDELTLAQRMLGQNSPETVLALGNVKPVVSMEELKDLRACLENITVRSEIMNYLVDIIRTTRTHESVLVGAGPRATQALLLAGRAYAAINGRDFVTPDDIKTMARAVLEHRIVLRPEYEIEGHTIPEMINEILKEVAVPR